MAENYKDLFDSKSAAVSEESLSKEDIAPSADIQAQYDDEVFNKLRTDLNVDFSDFNNFVWYGSAYDRAMFAFGDMLLYPSGSNLDNQTWYNSLDSYSRYVYSNIIDIFQSHTSYKFTTKFPPYTSLLTGSIVPAYMTEVLASGSLYDKENNAYCINFVDDVVWSDDNDDLKKMMLSFAGLFDRMKLYIDHFPKTKHVSYGEYNNVPVSLMKDIFDKFGFNQYGFYNSQGLDTYFSSANGLFNIKGEIWKRLLNNLIYILKSKGTTESIEALLRVHGFDKNTVKIREFSKLQDPIVLSRYRQYEIPYMALLNGTKCFSLGTGKGNNSLDFNMAFVPYVGYEDGVGQIVDISSFQYNTCSLVGNFDPATKDFYAVYAVRIPRTNQGYLHLTCSKTLIGGGGVNLVTSSLLEIFDKEPTYFRCKVKDEKIVVDVARTNGFYETITGSYISQNITGTFAIGAFNNEFMTASTTNPSLLNYNTEIYINMIRVYTDEAMNQDQVAEHILNWKSLSVYHHDFTKIYAIFPLQDNVDIQHISMSFTGYKTFGNYRTPETYPNTPVKLFFLTSSGTPPTENIFNPIIFDYSYIMLNSDFMASNKVRKTQTEYTYNGYEIAKNCDVNLVSIEMSLVDKMNEFIAQLVDGTFVSFPVNALDVYKISSDYDRPFHEIYEAFMTGSYPNLKKHLDATRWFDINFLKSLKQLVPVNVSLIEGVVLENPYMTTNKHYTSHYQDVKFSGDNKSLTSFSNNDMDGYWTNKQFWDQISDVRSKLSFSRIHAHVNVAKQCRFIRGQINSGQINHVVVSSAIPPIHRDFRGVNSNKIKESDRMISSRSYISG